MSAKVTWALLQRLQDCLHTCNAGPVTARIGEETRTFPPRTLLMESFAWTTHPNGERVLEPVRCRYSANGLGSNLHMYRETVWPIEVELVVIERCSTGR